MSNYRRANAKGATYFFTVALSDRKSNLLITEIDRLRSAYGKVQSTHPFTTIAICILPDHIHALWQLPECDKDFSMRWRLLKSRFSRGLPKAAGRSVSKFKHRESGIWQRRFWEHQIRDGRDLQQHFDYIHFNPVKHGHVARVADWPYSSFHRYVKAGDLPGDWAGAGADEHGLFGE